MIDVDDPLRRPSFKNVELPACRGMIISIITSSVLSTVFPPAIFGRGEKSWRLAQSFPLRADSFTRASSDEQRGGRIGATGGIAKIAADRRAIANSRRRT